MPYQKLYKRNRRPRPRRRRPQSRLADKKINTLVEKRIVDIAKKEADKARQWLVEANCYPANVASLSHFGTSVHELNSAISPLVNTSYDSNLSSSDNLCLTNFSAGYKVADSTVGQSGDQNKRLEFDLKQVQAFVSFYNQNDLPYQVSVALIGIPNANIKTASASNSSTGETYRLKPTRQMLCQNNWKFCKQDSGIFKGTMAHQERDTGMNVYVDHVILDRKTIQLPGGDTTANPKRVVHVKLNKVFKNPKKLYSTAGGSSGTPNVNQMTNYNIYLAWATDNANTGSFIGIQAIAGCKFAVAGKTVANMRTQNPE